MVGSKELPLDALFIMALTLSAVHLDECFFFFFAIFLLTHGFGLLSYTSNVKQLFLVSILFLARTELLVNEKKLSLNFVENG